MTSKSHRMGLRYKPMAFTEQGLQEKNTKEITCRMKGGESPQAIMFYQFHLETDKGEKRFNSVFFARFSEAPKSGTPMAGSALRSDKRKRDKKIREIL